MNIYSKTYPKHNVNIEVSLFSTEGGVAEYHAILHAEPKKGEIFEQQIQRIAAAKAAFMQDLGEETKLVFERYLLSDVANQSSYIDTNNNAATSIIQQEPLDGSKVALLLYLQKGTNVTKDGDLTVVEHNGYTHLWSTNQAIEDGDSYLQTHKLLFDYEDMLKKYGATFAENCVRTWFFVRDVDSNYAGMVKGRREHFDHIGLTPQTHYVASTGIGGSPSKGNAKVQLEGYSIKGLDNDQQRYLQALTHLNPTYEYGVTFERGTRVEYGDRGHVLISGTASINNKGEILYLGDVTKQTLRMWENVEVLLKEGNATYDDVAYMIIYLRDIADYETVKALYEERFPEMPKVFVHAPVCRPGWLIEMECIAITDSKNAKYAAF